MISKIKNKDFIFISLLFFLTPLFFYKLGNRSLTSFDEAWYADISRNILLNRDLLNITWNGKPFFDHPPAGFWLTSISYLVFGISNFSARFSQAFLGFSSLIITYFLGKELSKSRVVGFASAVSLSSSFWFLTRARSGNIDITLTFFFLTSILFAIYASRNIKWGVPFAISLALLVLTKTLVPFTILPVLLVIFFKSKLKINDYLKILVVFLIIAAPWFWVQYSTQPNFINKVFKIGLIGVSTETSYLENIKLTKDYIYFGIGRWFWPGFLSILVSPVIFLFSKNKFFLYIPILFFSFLIPFVFSHKVHIWHLIPLHPFMLISLFVVLHYFLKKIFKNLPRVKASKLLIYLILIISSFSLAFIQIKRSWYEFIDLPDYKSDIEILAGEAGKYDEKFYIDGVYGPEAVFYSGKNVRQISAEVIDDVFEDGINFVLITKQWRLDRYNIDENKYKILKKDRDKILIRHEL